MNLFEIGNNLKPGESVTVPLQINLRVRHNQLSTSEVEIGFLKMVIARMALENGKYLSENDKEAIRLLSEAHPQDIKETDLEWLALDDWEELNPNYKYAE